MTSYMVEYLWRHINLKLNQLGYLYVTWPKSRDVISVRYHVMKLITPENPGNELASFLEKKSRRVWERLGASFLEKISISEHFNYFYELFEKMDFWEMSKRHFWKKNPDNFLSLDLFSKNDAYSVPKKNFFKNSWPCTQEKSLDFFQEWRLLISRLLDFFPRFADRG